MRNEDIFKESDFSDIEVIRESFKQILNLIYAIENTIENTVGAVGLMKNLLEEFAKHKNSVEERLTSLTTLENKSSSIIAELIAGEKQNLLIMKSQSLTTGNLLERVKALEDTSREVVSLLTDIVRNR